MPQEIIILGATSSLIAVTAFGGAVYETFKLTSLRQLFDSILKEPVPQELLDTLYSLGGEDGDQSL
jgi:hypothetical protein